MKITIKDIAQKAGVSVATVSYVLNGTGSVSEEMSTKIKKIAEKYNYSPRAKKAKTTKPKYKVLVVLSPFSDDNTFFLYDSTYVAGCEQGLGMHNASMHFHRYESDELLEQIIETESPDGVILISCVPGVELNLPAISIGSPLNQPNFDLVRVDDTAIAEMATEKIVADYPDKVVLVNPIPGHPAFEKRLNLISHDLNSTGIKAETLSNLDNATLAKELITHIEQRHSDTIFIPGSDANVTNIYLELLKSGITARFPQKIYACANNPEHFGLMSKELNLLDLNLLEVGFTAADAIVGRIQRPESVPKRHLVTPTLMKSC